MLFAVYKSYFSLERPTQSRAPRRSLDYSWEQKPIFPSLLPSLTLKGHLCGGYYWRLPEALNTPAHADPLNSVKD